MRWDKIEIILIQTAVCQLGWIHSCILRECCCRFALVINLGQTPVHITLAAGSVGETISLYGHKVFLESFRI